MYGTNAMRALLGCVVDLRLFVAAVVIVAAAAAVAAIPCHAMTRLHIFRQAIGR